MDTNKAVKAGNSVGFVGSTPSYPVCRKCGKRKRSTIERLHKQAQIAMEVMRKAFNDQVVGALHQREYVAGNGSADASPLAQVSSLTSVAHSSSR